MSTESRSATIYPEPTPFPEGWYFVASRQDLLKAKIIQKPGWVKTSLHGVARTGGYVSPRPIARTSERISAPTAAGRYPMADLSAHSMASSSIPSGSALQHLTPTHLGWQG